MYLNIKYTKCFGNCFAQILIHFKKQSIDLETFPFIWFWEKPMHCLGSSLGSVGLGKLALKPVPRDLWLRRHFAAKGHGWWSEFVLETAPQSVSIFGWESWGFSMPLQHETQMPLFVAHCGSNKTLANKPFFVPLFWRRIVVGQGQMCGQTVSRQNHAKSCGAKILDMSGFVFGEFQAKPLRNYSKKQLRSRNGFCNLMYKNLCY